MSEAKSFLSCFVIASLLVTTCYIKFTPAKIFYWLCALVSLFVALFRASEVDRFDIRIGRKIATNNVKKGFGVILSIYSFNIMAMKTGFCVAKPHKANRIYFFLYKSNNDVQDKVVIGEILLDFLIVIFSICHTHIITPHLQAPLR